MAIPLGDATKCTPADFFPSGEKPNLELENLRGKKERERESGIADFEMRTRRKKKKKG